MPAGGVPGQSDPARVQGKSARKFADMIRITRYSGLKPETAAKALGVTRGFSEKGIIAPVEVTGRSLKAGLKWAGKIGAQVAVIIGEAELAAASAIVRDLERSEQQTVAMELVPEMVAGLLRESKNG